MEEKTIILFKNNFKRDLSDMEWIKEFYDYLQGEIPEGISLKSPLKLSPSDAYSVLWYLREYFPILPDSFTKCDVCDELFDDTSEGLYTETPNDYGFNFCACCDYLAPVDEEEES